MSSSIVLALRVFGVPVEDIVEVATGERSS
jgi:hypothetical protein